MLPASNNPTQPQQPEHLGGMLKEHPFQTVAALGTGFLAPFQSAADPTQPGSLRNLFTDLSYTVPGIGDVQNVRNVATNWHGSDVWEKVLMGAGLIMGAAGIAHIKNSALASRFVPEEAAFSMRGSQIGEPPRGALAQTESFPGSAAAIEEARGRPGSMVDPVAWERSKQQLIDAQTSVTNHFAASVKASENFDQLSYHLYNRYSGWTGKSPADLPERHMEALNHVADELKGVGWELVDSAVENTYFGSNKDEQQLTAVKAAVQRLSGLLDDRAFGDHNVDLRWNLGDWLTGKSSRETDNLISSIMVGTEKWMRARYIGPDNIMEPGQLMHVSFSEASYQPHFAVGHSFLPDTRLASAVTGRPGDVAAFMSRDRSVDPRSMIPELANNILLQLQVSTGLVPIGVAADKAVFYPKMNALMKELNAATDNLFDIPTLSACVTTLSARNAWLPDNVLQGIHLVLQTGRPDLIPGSEEYVNVVKDIVRKSGWAEEMHLDSPDFKQRLLSAARYQDGQVLDAGGLGGFHKNIAKGYSILTQETPEAERLLTLKYQTFAWLGVNPDDKMLATIDSLTAAFSRGLRMDEGAHWNEFMTHPVRKGGEYWQNPVRGAWFTPEGKSIPHEAGLRTWEADQDAFRLAAKWIQDHPESPIAQRINEIVNHPSYASWSENRDPIPSVLQAIAWSEWSDSTPRSRIGTMRSVLQDSYMRALQGDHQLNDGPMDAMRKAPSDLAPPPPLVANSPSLAAARAREYKSPLIVDDAGHMFLDTELADLNPFNGTHMSKIGVNGVHQLMHNTPMLVDTLGDVAEHHQDFAEVRTSILNPNEPTFDPYSMDSNVLTIEVNTPEDAQALMAKTTGIPAKIITRQISTGPMEAAHMMGDLSNHPTFTPTQLARLFDETDWAAVSPHISAPEGMRQAVEKLRRSGVEGIPDEATIAGMPREELYALLHDEPQTEWVRAFQEYETDNYTRLKQALSDARGAPGDALGQYEGEAEDAVFAFGVPVEEAARIAKAFHQESVATHAGLFFVLGDDAGKMIPASGPVEIGAHLLTPDSAGNIPDHTHVTLPNGQKVAFIAQYDGWKNAPGDLSVFSKRRIGQGGSRVQVHFDFGFKPDYGHIDKAHQFLARQDEVLSSQLHVNSDLYHTPGTVPVYERRYIDADGSQVTSRSRTSTGHTNEWKVFVTPEEAAKAPDTLPGRTVRQVSPNTIMYDNHVAVVFGGDGPPKQLPRNPLSSRGYRIALIELGDQPVIHLLDEHPGVKPTPGTVIVNALRGEVISIETAGTPADYENTLQLLDSLHVRYTDKVSSDLQTDLTHWADIGVDFPQANMNATITKMGEFKTKAYHGMIIPTRQSEMDVALTDRLGGMKALFDGHVNEEQMTQIGDVMDAFLTGNVGDTLPPSAARFFAEHAPLGKDMRKMMGDRLTAAFIKDAPYAAGVTTDVTVPFVDSSIHLGAGYLEAERSVPNFKERLRASHYGWHPDTPLTATQETLMHEVGHVVEAIVRKRGLGKAFKSRVAQAYKELGGNTTQVREALSGYAATNDSEMFAEAVLVTIATENPHPAAVSLVNDVWNAATALHVDKKNPWS